MAESVHVDCSAPPGPYEPDNDISGAGVSSVLFKEWFFFDSDFLRLSLAIFRRQHLLFLS